MARGYMTALATSIFLSSIAASLAQAGQASTPSRQFNNQCHGLFSGHSSGEPDYWKKIDEEIRPKDATVKYDDDISYLREFKRAGASGLVLSRFDSRLKTRFYFAATAVPDKSGKIPMVDPQAKAVYIFFHGSGTMKSSGKNFASLMNILGSLGYSALSFDMPFHLEGPTSPALHDPDVFMAWLNKVITEVRKQAGDKPIRLVGHSAGPDVISEYIFRNPFAVQGAALISPAGFDPVLADWYERKTSKMKFGGSEIFENTMGGQWFGAASSGFQWSKGDSSHDPTIVNPNLQVRVLSGDREEYVPGPLNAKGLPAGPNTYDLGAAIRKHLRNAHVTIEKGVGHYIFEHRDENGNNAVLREILALDGADVSRVSEIIQENNGNRMRSWLEQLSYNYAFDGIFQAWINDNVGESAFLKAVGRGDERMLRSIEAKYVDAKAKRESALVDRILSAADRDPEFYAKYKVAIDSVRSGKRSNSGSLFSVFADYLETEAKRARR